MKNKMMDRCTTTIATASLIGVLTAAVPAEAFPLLQFKDTGELAVTATAAGAPQTMVNVIGGGVLYSHIAQAEMGISSSADIWVRVTLDGVVLNGGFTRILEWTTTTATATAHCKGPFIDVNPRNNTDLLHGRTRGTPYTWVSGTTHTIIIAAAEAAFADMAKDASGNAYKASATPMFFNASLKIEIYKNTSGTVQVVTRALYGLQ